MAMGGAYDVGGINTVNIAGAYPAMGGDSLAQQASAFNDMPMDVGDGMQVDTSMPMPMTMPNGNAAAAMAMAPQKSSPAVWWATLAIMLFALMWIAEHFGSEGSNFSNVRLSFYNIFVLTIAVVLGLSLLKVGASKLPGNSVSQIIAAA